MVTLRIDCIVVPAVCIAGQMVEFGDAITPGSSGGLSVAQGARMPRRHTAYRGRFMTLAVTEASVP